MRIYRKSKGIKEPERFYDSYGNRKNIVGLSEPTYRENIKIFDGKKQLNYISYKQYNNKRL